MSDDIDKDIAMPGLDFQTGKSAALTLRSRNLTLSANTESLVTIQSLEAFGFAQVAIIRDDSAASRFSISISAPNSVAASIPSTAS